MQILREERLVICQAMTLQIQYAKLQAARETVFFLITSRSAIAD